MKNIEEKVEKGSKGKGCKCGSDKCNSKGNCKGDNCKCGGSCKTSKAQNEVHYEPIGPTGFGC